ncbi:MAG: DUF2240 family protein [Candidatus Thermoplasmatota archaeon]|nr:DUF2240 family protein [Candidatus Thermoplasmatota archaeon]
MSSEEKIVISFVFKRIGRDVIPVSQFYLTLSMDLKWFSPAESKEFVEKAVKNQLIIKNGDMLSPNFEFKKISIPLGFQPSLYCLNINSNESQGAYDNIIGCIMEKTKKPRHLIIDKIKIIAEEKNINLEIAALLLSKEYNVKIDKFSNEIEGNLFRESE